MMAHVAHLYVFLKIIRRIMDKSNKVHQTLATQTVLVRRIHALLVLVFSRYLFTVWKKEHLALSFKGPAHLHNYSE